MTEEQGTSRRDRHVRAGRDTRPRAPTAVATGRRGCDGWRVEADPTTLQGRQAVRAVVVDDAERVLLVRFRRPDGGAFWTTPGGGLERGESDVDALRRELREEVGLVDPEIGPCVWTRDHSFVWHRTIRQLERVYLVRIERHIEAPGVDLAAEGVDAVRWWTLDELAETPDELAPRQLVPALRDLLEGRIADRPYDVGV